MLSADPKGTSMADEGDGLDSTSIKPVSSLRSRFENISKEADLKPSTSAEKRQASLSPKPEGPERPRTSSGELIATSNAVGSNVVPSNGLLQPVPRKLGPSPAATRPQSMMDVTPSQRSPPMLIVHSLTPPPRDGIASRSGTPQSTNDSSRNASPTRSHARTLSRVATPALEARLSMFERQDTPPKIDLASKLKPAESKSNVDPAKAPPPVNRTAKPAIPSKPAALVQKPAALAAPKTTEGSEPSTSPFGTPPGSGSGSPDREDDIAPHRRQSSDASFVERLRSDSDASSLAYRSRADSDASFVQRSRGESDASMLARARAGSNASFVEPSSLPEGTFHPPPTHHSAASRREQIANGLARTPTMPSRYWQGRPHSTVGEVTEDRPRLPVRPELQMRSGHTSPSKPRSGRTSPSKLSQQIRRQGSMEGIKKAATFSEASPNHQRIPATKPAQRSALALGFDRSLTAAPAAAAVPGLQAAAKIAPAVPAPRRSADMRRPHAAAIPAAVDGSSTEDALLRRSTDTRRAHIPAPKPANGRSYDEEEDTTPAESTSGQSVAASDYPDASQTNRRPPKYKQRPWQIPTDYDTRLCAVSGEYVVTSGYVTKAWSLRTGESLMNMVHHEGTRATSVIFKPAADINSEGSRIWIGTNIGEIHEVDIPSQSLVTSRSDAHLRREVIRILRHGFTLWTLDDGGDLNVWQPGASGEPSLSGQYSNFRVPRGHTFSMACGSHLWLATGKDIRVFNPGARSDTEFQILRSPLSQPNTGEVVCGTTLSSKADLAFFGHSDGKVSVYNRRNFSCQAVLTVSLYKIASLAGVGEYLWAGFGTGMVYVYDMSTTPWKVKKDWEAHEKKQVCSIVADPSALWNMDRMHVVTLGTDNIIRIWDGFLEEDWLQSSMQQHDSQYCTFREITAAVMTWNAGASKPHYLQQDESDREFLRDYVTAGEPPDIFVFGFQELVDLEDKKVTAKSFFKSKKKESGEQEHMSRQYRAWRDHLTRCIEDNMPAGVTYALLHTASMVGLFTCIFVKSSERDRIKHVHTAEVKRGMGGLHGNKGALILRMVLDDSSICFINCHLAAGQTQTIHRNNDAAAILETEALPPHPLNQNSVAHHGDVFASGGDGSMILDHEICILNGDLNYRIDTMGRDTVIKHVQQNNLARLLERDQLLLSRKKNPGFRLRAFQESPITFAPTYKYNLHSDEYDNSEKRRSPAWCDRILYRGLGKVKMEEYRRWDGVRVSDHRPVSGRLRMRVKSVDAARREKVWKAVQGEFDEYQSRVGRLMQAAFFVDVLGMTAQEAKAAISG